MRTYIAPLVAIAAMLMVEGCSSDSNNDQAKLDTLPEGSTAAEAKQVSEGGHSHGSKAEELSAHTHTTRLEFSAAPAAIPVGAPATWTLRILDAKSGEPVSEFATVHEKLMHLIIVSSDLSWFNHIHPEYKGNGVFEVTTALPSEGSYKLYADYTPKGGSQEVAQHEFATGGGAPVPTSILPVHDTVGAGGWIVKNVGSAPEGFPEKKSGSYQVALMPMPRRIVAGEDVMLHFQVRDGAGKPLDAIEPYLGALGHCVLISSDTKIYLHTHPMAEGEEHAGHGTGEQGGMDHGAMKHNAQDKASAKASGATKGEMPATKTSEVMFHTNFPAAGIYKVWGQFQHKGKIVTGAFVLQVEAA